MSRRLLHDVFRERWSWADSVANAISLGARILVTGTFVVGCSGCGTQHAAPVDCGLGAAELESFVRIPGGVLKREATAEYPEERGLPDIEVKSFLLQNHEVTNAQFDRFVQATGYTTDAERSASRPDGGSGVFEPGSTKGSAGRWTLRGDANWRRPEAGKKASAMPLLPVVHVSHNDAIAYARWAGARLPTEAEWEIAAQQGLPDPRDAASGARSAAGRYLANTWQGIFPLFNTADDGFSGLAPVGCFPPDRLGLYDMIGNAWEWTSTSYKPSPGAMGAKYTIKGGSYLCSDNYCRRYRPAARQPQDHDFSTSHIGFRIAKDP